MLWYIFLLPEDERNVIYGVIKDSCNEPVADAVDKIKQETRHFAKRQITWFKREKNTNWIEKEQFASEQEIVNYCIKECKKITTP